MHSTADNTQTRAAAGMLMMCVGVACLSINDALSKALASTYSPLQILFLRNLIALPFAVVIAFWFGGAGGPRSSKPMAHLLRGVLWVIAAFLFVTSLKHLGLAEATALVFVAPLFITGASALFLGEQVGWRRWLAVVFGFVGVLIAIRPGGAAFQPAALLPLATALFYAFLMVSARWVDKRESVWTLLLYLTGAGALLSSLAVPFVWVPVQSSDIGLFVAVAFFGTAGMTLMTQAFRLAPAVVVAPLDYTALIWATLAGWLVWSEWPDAPVFVGAAIIVASGVFTIWREHRLSKGSAPAAPSRD